MAVDYYKLLQVQRTANDDELKKAADSKIKQIQEAYEVLSDPRKRAVYDQHEEGLRRVPLPRDSAGLGGLDGFSSDHIFSEFFRSRPTRSRVSDSRTPEEVFSTLFGGRGGCQDEFRSFGFADAAEGSGNGRTKAAAIERILACSLEELYNGTTKKMKISRDIVGASGKRSTVEEVVTIEIKRGWKKGTKITFPEKGNDVDKDVVPADIIFIIDEKPHGLFKRDGNDLIVTRKIPLVEALTGATQLTTLDGRNLAVCFDYTGSLTHEEVVQGEGMPIQNEPSRKGNLIVKFDVKFPRLTSQQKTGIKQLLK